MLGVREVTWFDEVATRDGGLAAAFPSFTSFGSAIDCEDSSTGVFTFSFGVSHLGSGGGGGGCSFL